MIASAMDRSDLQPDQESNDNFQTAKGNLDTAMCDIKEKTRFYSKRQLRIHGELREQSRGRTSRRARRFSDTNRAS